MKPEYNSPKPTPKVKWGISQITKPLPRFAKRLGAALTAVSVAGFAYQFLEGDAMFARIMAYAGLAGAFLTTLFGKDNK